MDRYILFGGDFYYATGGANDIIEASDNWQVLADNVENDKYIDRWGDKLELDWWHIYDCHENEILCGSKEQAFGARKLFF